MKELWAEAVGSARLAEQVSVYPGYAFLGSELPQEQEATPLAPWKIRLSLTSIFSQLELSSLLEDVDEVYLSGRASELLDKIPVGIEVFLQVLPQVGVSSLSPWLAEHLDPSEDDRIEPFEVGRRVWVRGSQALVDRYFRFDLQVLRNLSLLYALIGRQTDAHRFVVFPLKSSRQGQEALVEYTLSYWAGAVGGCRVLEVVQDENDNYESLCERLGILRLMRWESGLDGSQQIATLGSGFFGQLADSLKLLACRQA